MVDVIIEFIRAAKTGVSSVELAERFLKFKNPPAKFAQAAISGIIAGDKRCQINADGFWIFDESGMDAVITLEKLPLCIVYMLADSQRKKINYISIWNVFPYPQFCGDVWLHNPSTAIKGVDLSGIVFSEDTIENRLVQIVSMLSEKLPVLLSDDDMHLFNTQFENDVLTDKNRVILLNDLLEVLSIDIPDNYTLSQVLKIFNDDQFPDSPQEQAKLFAVTVSDVLKLLNEKKIFTKEELDHAVMLTRQQMIAGKQFSLQQIQNLPEAPGVYGLKDNFGKYLFISKCRNLQQSILGHFRKYRDSSKKRIAEETVSFDAHRCGSELECELFEYRLIKKYNPCIRKNNTLKPSDIPGNCILFLPHPEPSKVLSIWVFVKRKIVMKSFTINTGIPATVDAELANYFYTLPDFDQSDPFERDIIGSFLKKNPDLPLLMVPSSLTVSDLVKEFKERIKKFVEN